jgi:lysophospholipase L1-like esterase
MKLKKILVLAGSVLLSLIILEVGLRVLSATLIYSPKNSQVYDEKLGRRIDPSLPGIDENGFRNPEVPGDTGIVVLGDSHTYGVNVKSDESWPAQLARMSGMSAYNLGVGGYGPLQYYYLMDKALSFKPRYVILGLYPANDLSDVCKMIDESEYWRDWALKCGYDAGICAGSVSLFGRINRTLSGLHVYWMAASAVKRLNESMNFGDALEVTEGDDKTIMKYATISSHKKKMDVSREKVSFVLAVTEDVIREMKSKADAEGVEFGVVLIPSKEIAFYDYLKTNGYKLPDDYEKLVSYENELAGELAGFFTGLGIDYADARSYVVTEVEKSITAYSPTDDGHPLEAGYEAYARAAYEGILTDDPHEKESLNLRQ